MNPARALRRLARILATLAAAALTVTATTAAALAAPRPRPPGWNKHPPLPASPQPALRFPPGWNKHPLLPDPARVHADLSGGIPGWQLTLMAVTVVLLAATLVAIAYPGPGRTAAGEPAHRRNDDPLRRSADPQGQPAALARPAPADRDR